MSAEELDIILARMNKVLPTEEDKLNMLATLTGASTGLAIFIAEHRDFIAITREVHYMMCLVISMAKSIDSDADIVIRKDMALIDVPENERLIMVLKWLVETYKEELGL
jgi:hypothetical protein